MQFSTVIGQFTYCLRLTALRFCMCHGLYKGCFPFGDTSEWGFDHQRLNCGKPLGTSCCDCLRLAEKAV